jgi:hypothetical protein
MGNNMGNGKEDIGGVIFNQTEQKIYYAVHSK